MVTERSRSSRRLRTTVETVASLDAPASFLAEHLDPIFVGEVTSTELVLDVDDNMLVIKERGKPSGEAWR
jgi:hypothetical protein